VHPPRSRTRKGRRCTDENSSLSSTSRIDYLLGIEGFHFESRLHFRSIKNMQFVDASGGDWWCASADGSGIWSSSTGEELDSSEFFAQNPAAVSMIYAAKQQALKHSPHSRSSNKRGPRDYAPRSGSHYKQYKQEGSMQQLFFASSCS
jgi:hypothetical protein